ncbi:hypothetical protein GJAV_G00234720, partial [Gymnothorax javanicus]
EDEAEAGTRGVCHLWEFFCRCYLSSTQGESSLISQEMPTQKECVTCHQKIGVAAKTCPHCGAKQPYKTKLEKAKKKINDKWKNTQSKNHSVNKVYDSSNLLLHKWDLLERHPILLLAKRVGPCYVGECLCPREMNSPREKDALLAIQTIYETLINGSAADLAPSATAVLNKEKEGLTFLRQKLECQTIMIEELVKERDFLRGQLSLHTVQPKEEPKDDPVTADDYDRSLKTRV